MLDPNASPIQSMLMIQFRKSLSDATDLNWVQLMNAYTCTECGRCTDECPANQTGKLLSPRKIMMDTRDRLEEVGRKSTKMVFIKMMVINYWTIISLGRNYGLVPHVMHVLKLVQLGLILSIIMDMRQYLVMEQSAAQ